MSVFITGLTVFAFIVLAMLTAAATTVQLIRSIREFRIGYHEIDEAQKFHRTF